MKGLTTAQVETCERMKPDGYLDDIKPSPISWVSFEKADDSMGLRSSALVDLKVYYRLKFTSTLDKNLEMKIRELVEKEWT